MDAKTLKTACLGLDLQAQDFLNLAAESEFFNIVAIADSDAVLAQKTAQQYNCAAFNDYRQLTVQNQLDVLIVGSPLCECAEYVRLAISKKCNILKLVPTASSFDEAAELIKLATKNSLKYITACSSRFARPFVALKDYTTEMGMEEFYFINAFYNTNQSKTELFDTGVLLNKCFEIVDAIVLNFSLPQRLYALVTNQAPDKKQRQYLPEQAAAITMQFAGGLIGNFVAGRTINDEPWLLTAHGRKGNIAVMPNKFRVYDKNNHLLDDRHFSTSNKKKELLNDFAQSILYPAGHKLRYESSVDLATMAFIDSAYLSAKTAMPEAPQKIFEISKNRIVGT